MGMVFSTIFSSLFGKKNIRILMVGLDGAGKTTVLFRLKLGEVVTSIPTIGFNVETVEYKNVSFTVWDVGGQSKIKQLWKHYYHNSQAVIFVIDSLDRERIHEAEDALHDMLEAFELRDALVLILANKQDLPDVMSIPEITDKLSLKRLRNRWYIQGASAVQGYGLSNALDWLACELEKK